MSWVITGSQKNKGLLDEFTGAAAAYSLRNLSLLQNPYVVRVRRSNDNTEQDFTAIEVSDGTLAAWVGAGNNGFVRTWYDQSGNSRDMQQATAAYQPQIVSSGVLITEGGKPALLTTNSSTMALTSAIGLSSHSVFMAIQSAVEITQLSRQDLWRSDNPTADIFSFGPTTASLTDERLSWLTVESSIVYGFGQVANNYAAGKYLISAIWNGTLASVFFNSSSQSLTASSSGGGFTSTIYARFFQRLLGTSSGTAGYSGKVFEFCLYPSNQSSNRTAIEANINAHYSIY